MACIRTMTHYPIDDVMFGLNEEQTAVSQINFMFVLSINVKFTVIPPAATSDCFQFRTERTRSIRVWDWQE